jgi:peroxiredoxin
MHQFIRQHDLRFPIALDPQHVVAQRYGVQGTPTTYLIDRAGKVIGITVGAQHWTRDAAKKRIRQLLNDAS